VWAAPETPAAAPAPRRALWAPLSKDARAGAGARLAWGGSSPRRADSHARRAGPPGGASAATRARSRASLRLRRGSGGTRVRVRGCDGGPASWRDPRSAGQGGRGAGQHPAGSPGELTTSGPGAARLGGPGRPPAGRGATVAGNPGFDSASRAGRSPPARDRRLSPAPNAWEMPRDAPLMGEVGSLIAIHLMLLSQERHAARPAAPPRASGRRGELPGSPGQLALAASQDTSIRGVGGFLCASRRVCRTRTRIAPQQGGARERRSAEALQKRRSFWGVPCVARRLGLRGVSKCGGG